MAATQAPVRVASRWPDVGRGMTAATAMAALVAGVPWALARFVGWPLPAAMPSWSEITTALGDSYIPDSFLTKALALVCWIVWVELVASLLVEAVAVVRGRRAGTVPLAGPVQRLAARLVAALSLLVVLVLSRPDHDVQAVTPLLPTPATAELASTAAPEPATATAGARAAAPSYVVERRDTLWGVAEAQLGDPLRWVEIWELNRGRPQPDGRVLTDPDRICPGWTLQLPTDAAMAGSGGLASIEPTSSPGDGAEPMVPLDAAAAPDGTRLVSDRGAGPAVEVMVPLESGPSPVSHGEPLLAAGESGASGDAGAIRDVRARPDEQRDR